MKIKLIKTIKYFVNANETHSGLEEYFKDNEPSGPYYNLAKYFKNESERPDPVDENYKKWLTKLIDKGEESKSIVLTCLQERYTTKEELKNFVFLANDEKPELNQKWHYFISYWGLKEFVTRYPNKNYKSITPLNQNARYIHNGYIRCKELKYWCNNFNLNK